MSIAKSGRLASEVKSVAAVAARWPPAEKPITPTRSIGHVLPWCILLFATLYSCRTVSMARSASESGTAGRPCGKR